MSGNQGYWHSGLRALRANGNHRQSGLPHTSYAAIIGNQRQSGLPHTSHAIIAYAIRGNQGCLGPAMQAALEIAE
jgi:hypothetical protein